MTHAVPVPSHPDTASKSTVSAMLTRRIVAARKGRGTVDSDPLVADRPAFPVLKGALVESAAFLSPSTLRHWSDMILSARWEARKAVPRAAWALNG